MGIAGNLKTMELAELLQWLSQGQKSGTLVFEHESYEKKIYFDKGFIISSASNDPAEYLGQFLVSRGFLTQEQANEALARQKNEQTLIGQLLVELGFIDSEQLKELLQLKAEETIYDIFSWEEGEFHFLDQELPEESMIDMRLDVQWIVLEGSRRVDEWQRIREVLPSPMTVPVSVCDLSQLESEDEMERRILGAVDDDRTVEEIGLEAAVSLFHVSKVLAEHVELGNLKAVRPRIVEVRAEPEEKEQSGEEAQAQPAPSSQPVPQPMPQMQQIPYAMPPPGAPQQMPVYVAQPPPAQEVPASVNVGSHQLQFAATPQAPGIDPVSQAPPPSEADSMLREAETLLAQDDLAAALQTFRRAREVDGGSHVEGQVQQGEEKVRQALEKEGLKLSAIPKLKLAMDELSQLDISPQEGFMLTRVDGSYDIKSILQMSPMPKLDTLILFWRLKRLGHVSL